MTMKKMSIWGLVAVCATGILAGCNESEIHTSAFAQTPPAPAQGQGKAAKLNADAGVPIGVAATPTAFDDAKAKSFATRTNAFSLLPTEAKFNKEQTAARLVGELGGNTAPFDVMAVRDTAIQDQCIQRRVWMAGSSSAMEQ